MSYGTLMIIWITVSPDFNSFLGGCRLPERAHLHPEIELNAHDALSFLPAAFICIHTVVYSAAPPEPQETLCGRAWLVMFYLWNYPFKSFWGFSFISCEGEKSRVHVWCTEGTRHLELEHTYKIIKRCYYVAFYDHLL